MQQQPPTNNRITALRRKLETIKDATQPTNNLSTFREIEKITKYINDHVNNHFNPPHSPSSPSSTVSSHLPEVITSKENITEVQDKVNIEMYFAAIKETQVNIETTGRIKNIVRLYFFDYENYTIPSPRT